MPSPRLEAKERSDHRYGGGDRGEGRRVRTRLRGMLWMLMMRCSIHAVSMFWNGVSNNHGTQYAPTAWMTWALTCRHRPHSSPSRALTQAP